MKKLLFILILLTTSLSYSQSWKFKTFTSDFDGKYKLARVYGTGGEFPYQKPDLVVIKHSGGSVDIYVSEAGYSGCDNKFIYFKFNGDEKTYQTNSVGGGANNDSWFVHSMEDITTNELLEKFTKHNSVAVRLGSNCGRNDFKFSLRGSTKALNNVLGYGWLKKQLEKEEEIIKKYKERKRKKEEEILKKYIENTELKRKKDSVKRVNDILEKRKKEEEIKLNRVRCRELNSSFTGYNYKCYTFYGKEIRRKMQDPRSAIKVKKGTVLIVDKEFKNRVFYKVSLIDGLSKFTSYVFKKDVEITP